MPDHLKPIPGWEGLYSACEDGRIWAHPRVIVRKNGATENKAGRWLKFYPHEAGYWTVNLCRGGGAKPQKRLVHRLVALAWVPNDRPDRIEVNHDDSDRSNPKSRNLEWMTPSENIKHSYNSGKRAVTVAQRERAARMGRARRSLDDDKVAMAILLRGSILQREIAQFLGCPRTTINQLFNGKRYLGA